jgi:hypothetical protein
MHTVRTSGGHRRDAGPGEGKKLEKSEWVLSTHKLYAGRSYMNDT